MSKKASKRLNKALREGTFAPSRVYRPPARPPAPSKIARRNANFGMDSLMHKLQQNKPARIPLKLFRLSNGRCIALPPVGRPWWVTMNPLTLDLDLSKPEALLTDVELICFGFVPTRKIDPATGKPAPTPVSQQTYDDVLVIRTREVQNGDIVSMDDLVVAEEAGLTPESAALSSGEKPETTCIHCGEPTTGDPPYCKEHGPECYLDAEKS